MACIYKCDATDCWWHEGDGGCGCEREDVTILGGGVCQTYSPREEDEEADDDSEG